MKIMKTVNEEIIAAAREREGKEMAKLNYLCKSLQKELNKVSSFLKLNEEAFKPFSFDFDSVIEYMETEMEEEFPLVTNTNEYSNEEILMMFFVCTKLDIMDTISDEYGLELGTLKHPVPLQRITINPETIVELSLNRSKVDLDSTINNILDEFYGYYTVFKVYKGKLQTEYIEEFLENNPELELELTDELIYIIADIGKAIEAYTYDILVKYQFLAEYNKKLLYRFKNQLKLIEEDLKH